MITALLALACASTHEQPANGAGPTPPPVPEPTAPTEPTDPPVMRTAPLPVWGGTVIALADGRFAATDPDGDRVALVTVDAEAVVPVFVALPPGSQPFRLVEADDGALWFTARGRGALFRLDPATGGLDELAVCAAPRGLAARGSEVVVACGGGELVHVAGGAVTRVDRLDDDLRDVVSIGAGWWVSRFRSAEILQVSAQGAVTGRLSPPIDAGAHPASLFPPSVAWRMIADPEGGVVLAHQRASDQVIDLGVGFGLPAYGGASCDHVVQAAVTRFAEDGTAETTGPMLKTALPVDVLPRAAGGLWLVSAGADWIHDVALNEISDALFGLRDTCTFMGGYPWSAVVGSGGGRVVGAAESGGTLLAVTQPFSLAASNAWGPFDRHFDAPTNRDGTGHALFHRAPTATLACASCHPEGREDGRTWRFEQGLGEELRRTQSLAGGVAATTAPLHWLGEHADLASLLEDTLEQRMGSAMLPEDPAAFEAFLAEIPLDPGSPGDPAAVAAGEVAFTAAGCDTCHLGPTFTDGLSHDVGTADRGGAGTFQTPSLLGVGQRGPWMHDGCASTLLERFDPTCGGADHGTSPDDPGDQAAIVAYLESL